MQVEKIDIDASGRNGGLDEQRAHRRYASRLSVVLTKPSVLSYTFFRLNIAS